MTLEPLSSRSSIRWISDRTDAECDVYIGEGANALEIVVTTPKDFPTKQFLERTWRDRRDGRPNPVVIVALHDDDTAALFGPSGDDPPLRRGLETDQAGRIVYAALEKPSRFAAQRFIREAFEQLDDDLVGVRNQGLLTTHELKKGVPERDDWDNATSRAVDLLNKGGKSLIQELGFEVDRLNPQTFVLKNRNNSRDTAVAIFLNEDESFDHTQDRFTGQTPVGYGINEAEEHRLEYVVATSGDTLRLYTTDPDAGFGSRGKTDTFVEINTNLLSEENAGYLWLLFSANALEEGGTLEEIIESSQDYATSLGKRLRERIYDDVIPDLAEAIAEARNLDNPSRDELDQTYRMALFILYRLLFIAYAEDERFLPRHNPNYRRRSLKKTAHELHDITTDEAAEFDSQSTTYWDEFNALADAIHEGQSAWGLPEYNGTLLSSDSSVSETGALLNEIELVDDVFGPILTDLLIDETLDDVRGPIDFRDIGVREFGVIYEGLLESELSVADQPLIISEDDRFIPPTSDDVEPDINEGEVYLHGQSGERKSSGTYYTKKRFVEHLLDYSLDPALDDHIEELERVRQEDGKSAAAEKFFDFRVADLAMGSGHFLVGAVDRIESKLMSYLARDDVNLPEVEQEIDRLRDAAESAFEGRDEIPEVERSQLLRRQVARRCVYGVDLNEEAAELARLSLWIHTFVPGLPLTFLDYNLRAGDSLIGVGTVEEVDELTTGGRGQSGLRTFVTGDEEVFQEIKNKINRIGQIADADAEQVKKARETREDVKDALEQAEATCDVIAGSYLDEGVNLNLVSNKSISEIKGTKSHKKAKKALEPFNTLHFPTTFPEVFMGEEPGFDVILGNPPWDKVIFEEQQFWVTRFPGLNSLSNDDRKKKIKELRENHPPEAKEEEKENAFRDVYQTYVGEAYDKQGWGHYDYSKLFVERVLNLLNENGRLGYVLPRQCLVLSGWQFLRRELLDGSELTVLQARNGGGWIFEDVEERYMMVLLTQENTEDNEAGAQVWPGITSTSAFEEVSPSNSLYFSYDDLVRLTTEDDLVIPWFNNHKSRDIFPNLESHERLSSDSGWITGTHDSRWDFRGSGRHDDLVNDDLKDDYWNICRTRNVDQYRINEEKAFRGSVNPEQLLNIGRGLVKRNDDIVFGEDHPTVMFRHVSRSTDTRTLIGCILPETGYIYNSGYIHAIEHKEGTDQEQLFALLAYLNSFIGDWWARRFADRHVTAPIINNLPIPEWNEEQIKQASKLAIEMTSREGIEVAAGNRQIESVEELTDDTEVDIRAKIEGLVADGFNLQRDHVDTLLDDFSEDGCPSDMRDKILNEVNNDNE